MIRLLLLINLYLGLMSSFAFAAQSDNQIDSLTYKSSSSFLMVQLVISLALVLGLIYLFFWILKKKQNITSSKLYNHLGGIPLGQNKSVQVIEIGNKIYLLGVGNDIRTISILESEDEIEAIKSSTRAFDSSNYALSAWLKNKFYKNNNINPNNQFEVELAEKMGQLKDKRSQSMNDWFEENERYRNK